MRILRRNATNKGLIGGQRGWLAVFAILGGARFLSKHVGKDAQHLTSEKLLPGQSMTIRAIPVPTRQERKVAQRVGKASR